jgi:hypothetical protein
MRRHLKEAEADEKPLQRYACPGCGETYSSMDAANLLDFATGELRCGECRCAVHGICRSSLLCLLLLHCVELEVVLFSAQLCSQAQHITGQSVCLPTSSPQQAGTVTCS